MLIRGTWPETFNENSLKVFIYILTSLLLSPPTESQRALCKKKKKKKKKVYSGDPCTVSLEVTFDSFVIPTVDFWNHCKIIMYPILLLMQSNLASAERKAFKNWTSSKEVELWWSKERKVKEGSISTRPLRTCLHQILDEGDRYCHLFSQNATLWCCPESHSLPPP